MTVARFLVFVDVFSALISCGANDAEFHRLSESSTLPRSSFTNPHFEADFYPQIVKSLDAFKLDYQAMPELLKLVWLLKAPARLLTRFGTPTLIGDVATTPSPSSRMGYMHEALDIVTDGTPESDVVYAPLSGKAILAGERDDPYGAALVIYDETSHLVISMLHVVADARFLWDQLTEVEQGEILGKLAPVSSMKPEYEAAFRHTHLAILNVEDKLLLNPISYFQEYEDNTKPTINSLYFFDEHANKLHTPKAEKLDIVVEAFDRDELSHRNFEIAHIKYTIKDQDGVILKRSNCKLDPLTARDFKGLNAQTVLDLLDVEGSVGQLEDHMWIDGGTDASNPARTFRYAITNIRNATRDDCELQEDREGFVTVSARTKGLTLDLSLSDYHGNSVEGFYQFSW